MKTLAGELLKALNKSDLGISSEKDYIHILMNHNDGKPPRTVVIWELQGREYVRDVPLEEYEKIRDETKGTVINMIEGDGCHV